VKRTRATDFYLPSPETVEAAMTVLSRVPKTWAAVPGLSHLESQGLGLLVAGGLVERRISMRLRVVGDKRAVAIRFRFTGQGGLAEAVEPGLAEAWNLWEQTWREGKRVYAEPGEGDGEWRLTDQGQEARQQLAHGEVGYLRDYLRTPGEPGREAMPPHLRFVPGAARPVVAGEGHAERVEVISADAEPLQVQVTNLEELSGPIGEIGRVVEAGFQHLAYEAKRLAVSGRAPAKQSPASRRGRPKVSDQEAARRRRIIAAWERAKAAGVSRKEFCNDFSEQHASQGRLTPQKLENIQDWARQRALRKDSTG